MEVLHILIRVSTQIQEDDGTSLKTQQEQGIEITLFLKIPLVFGYNKTQDLKNVPIKNTSVSLTGPTGQPDTLWDYSTVTDFAKLRG